VATSARKLSPESLGFGRQPAALVIREPQELLPKLLAQNTVLLTQVSDHLQLALIRPSGNSDHYKPERMEGFRHLVASLSTGLPTEPQCIFKKISGP
jgi:hypothetical protein